MKIKLVSLVPARVLAISTALFSLAATALAQNGTWTNLSGGSWTNAANWSGGVIATGATNTADFSTLTLSAPPVVTLDGARANGNLIFGDAGNTYGWTLSAGAAGPLTLGGTSLPVITVNNQTATIGAVLAGTAGLAKAGAGTLTLTATNTYTGGSYISNGIVNYSGGGGSTGGGSLYLGIASGNKAVLNEGGSGTASFSGTISVGGNGASSGGAGVINQTAGTFNLAGGGYAELGYGGYGSYALAGGSLNFNSSTGIRIGDQTGGLGNYLQTGGTCTMTRYFVVGANSGTAPVGLATFTGGTFLGNNSSSYYIILGNAGTATSTLNIGTEAGGNAVFASRSTVGIQLNNAGTTTNTLNLNSGTLQFTAAKGIYKNTVAGGNSVVNFNGATLQAAGANAFAFINNTPNSVNVYNGGLVMDTQGNTVTNSANMVAAAGKGIYPAGGTLAISSGGGSGYLGAPLVTSIATSGTGFGATAIANVSGGVVTGVTLTCPGQNYAVGDTVTFNFAGGGTATAASPFVHTLVAGDLSANVLGGLAKLGSGTLALTGTNTYSGGTVVNAGTLNVTADGGLGSGNVIVANGATLTLGGGVTNGYIGTAANLLVGSTAVVNLNYSGTDTVYALSTDGGNTFVSPGVYGSAASGAPNSVASFTGSGQLNVLSKPSLSVALSSSANPAITRQPVTFTGTVAGNSGTPTGTVTFKNGTNVLGTVALNGSGVATITTTFTAVENDSITAAYSGNGSYPAFTSPVFAQTVIGGNDLWTGAANGTWDINLTTNWTQAGTPISYGDGDYVQLDDSATGTTAVVLNTTVSPSGILFSNNADNYSVSGTGTIAGTGGLTMAGSGSVTFSNTNNYTGTTLISNGVVSYVGGGGYGGGSGANLLVGGATGEGVFNMNSTGTVSFTANTPYIGGTGGAADTGAGAINQTSGTMNLGLNGGVYLTLGGGSSTAYGAYNLSAGALNISSTSGMRIGLGGLGTYLQSGGILNCPRYFVVGGNNTTAGSLNLGVATFTGGAAFATNGYFVILGDLAGANGTLNLGTEAGGNATFTTTTATGPQVAANSGATGTLNLNSGTLAVGGPIATASGGTGAVNLNGGTIQAGANNITLLDTTPAVTVYNGGLVVNSQTNTATITASLAPAAGAGIYPAGGLFTVTSGGGSGYIGAPAVTVTGGSGSGATAIATVTNGMIANVILTCPGQNYQAGDVLSFSFAGGGTATPATTYNYTLQAGDLTANSAGGVTKTGTGTLTLSGSLTYTGPTLVNGGKLSLPSGSSATGVITVNSNATLSAQSSVAANVAVTNGGTLGDLFNTPLYLNGTVTLGASATDVTTLALSADGTGVDGNLTTYGSLTVNGTNKVNIAGSLPLVSPATYTLLNYSGGISGAGKFVTGTLPAFVSGYVTNTGTEIDLVVLATDTLVWSGSPTNTWDLSGVHDWKLASSGAPIGYLDGGIVAFDDTAHSFVVNLGTNVAPNVVNVNSTSNYVFTGTGGISGAAQIVKTNSGTLTLLGTNTYTGGTVINGGTVQLGNGLADGVIGAGAYTVNGGASLYLDYATYLAAGTGLWSANITGSGTLELNSAEPATAIANWGPNSATATPFNSAFSGTLQIDNGRMDASPAGLGGITNIVISTNGGQFLAWAGGYSQSASIAGQNGWGESGYPGALRLAAGASASWNGGITLTANSGIDVQRNSTFTIYGSITGPFQCQFNTGDPSGANGTLMIAPTAGVPNSYGSTLVTGHGGTGAVVAGNQYAFSPGPLALTSGGTLELYSFDFSFASLSGSGGTVGNFSGSPSVITVGSDNTSTSYGGTLIDGNAAASLALTKIGGGTLTLTGNNSFSGGTIVSNGTLQVDGGLSGPGAVVVSGGTLDGNGGIAGSVTVNSGTLSAGTPVAIGILSITNTLTLADTVVLKISKTGGVRTNDAVLQLTGVTYGGTLWVTNITSDATALAAGDTFTLFGSTSYTPGFIATNLPVLPAGLGWDASQLAVNGSIQVVATVNTTPTNVTATAIGNVLHLSWPADHTGWRLLVQTNNLRTGVSVNTNDWTTVTGSAGTNQLFLLIDTAKPTEFYRLVYP